MGTRATGIPEHARWKEPKGTDCTGRWPGKFQERWLGWSGLGTASEGGAGPQRLQKVGREGSRGPKQGGHMS